MCHLDCRPSENWAVGWVCIRIMFYLVSVKIRSIMNEERVLLSPELQGFDANVVDQASIDPTKKYQHCARGQNLHLRLTQPDIFKPNLENNIPSTLTRVASHNSYSARETHASMAPNLTEDEIDDLLYLARTGENDELSSDISRLSARESITPAELLTAAKDESKATCLHMATGNGHLGNQLSPFPSTPPPSSPLKKLTEDFKKPFVSSCRTSPTLQRRTPSSTRPTNSATRGSTGRR